MTLVCLLYRVTTVPIWVIMYKVKQRSSVHDQSMLAALPVFTWNTHAVFIFTSLYVTSFRWHEKDPTLLKKQKPEAFLI